MTYLIVKMLTGNKYLAFGIAFVICIGNGYLAFNTPFEKVLLNCVHITSCLCAAPFMGWHCARILEVD
jgi:hypothetical protein